VSQPHHRRRHAQVSGAAAATTGASPRRVVVAAAPAPRVSREQQAAESTRFEADRRHAEQVRPLAALAAYVAQTGGQSAELVRAALDAAVGIYGSCPAGWCALQEGHSGACLPLEAA